VREEALIFCALAIAAASIVWRMGWHHYEATLWAALLAAQAIPYLAALACGFISRRSFKQAVHAPVGVVPVSDNAGHSARSAPVLMAEGGRSGQRS
jgi:hypothetical protein